MSADEEGYNGWKNYETWSVALVIDNDQSLYNERRRLVEDAASNAPESEYWTPEEARKFAVADALRAWIEDEVPQMAEQVYGPLCYLWSQLLGAALSEVDWNEIAENWLEDYDESEDE